MRVGSNERGARRVAVCASGGMNSMRERRSGSRQAFKAKVTITVIPAESVDAPSRPMVCKGWTQDVSLGGLHLRTRKALPVHAKADMDVHCERPAENMKLRGRVEWVRRESDTACDVGIFIEDTPRDDLIAWHRMLVRRGLAH